MRGCRSAATRARRESRDADDDECVGEVERRPEAEVEEVRHMTDPEPVDEVAHAPTDEQPERNREDRMASARLREVEEHPDDCTGGQEGDGGGPAGEETECDPRVVHVPDPERPDDVDGLAEARAA